LSQITRLQTDGQTDSFLVAIPRCMRGINVNNDDDLMSSTNLVQFGPRTPENRSEASLLKTGRWKCDIWSI